MGTVREEIAKNIAFYRKRSAMTQRRLAELVGVKHNSVSTWESGANAPDVELIYKIAGIFGVTVAELYGQDIPAVKVSSAARHVARLYDRADDRARGIVDLTLKPFDTAMEENAAELHPSLRNLVLLEESGRDEDAAFLPYYTQSASAGIGNYLDDNDYEMMRFRSVPARANIAVRVSGDSMEPAFYDGGIVFVETESVLQDGEIGIFCCEGEAFIKQLRTSPPRLVSLNKKYKPIMIREDASIYTLGRVLGAAELYEQ